MSSINTLEKEIRSIKQRNYRVELDKKWETSIARKIILGFLTYVVIVIFFLFVKVERPFINAIVPTLGYLLSTFTLTWAKKIWLKNVLKSEE